MPSRPKACRWMRLLWLPLLTGAACTVVSDPFQPRVLEALSPDAGAQVDAGAEPVGPVEPGPGGLVPPAPVLPPDAGLGCTATGELAGCELPQVVPPSCTDNERNQGEADTDCGGPCATQCGDGLSCARTEDCASGFCSAAGRCALASCGDSELNGSETDIDCGGSCAPCPVAGACSVPTDCVTGVCTDGACAAATCNDEVQNQNEVDVDCGGSCAPCPPGARCTEPDDCSEEVCTAQGCAEGVALCCQPARCNDDVQNGTEPVTDCGLAPCPLCPLGNPCSANAQCATNRCAGGNCALPLCLDGQENGNESDEDCGGNDPQCQRCEVGQDCNTPADCASGSCLNGECADCNNDDQDDNETDVDCGGVCGPCGTGQDCDEDDDCASGACEDDRCCGGNQGDCVRCALRLVGNINCGTNNPAGQVTCEQFLQCLAENTGSCPTRNAATCTAPGAVCDPALFGGNGSPGIVNADAILGTAQCAF